MELGQLTLNSEKGASRIVPKIDTNKTKVLSSIGHCTILSCVNGRSIVGLYHFVYLRKVFIANDNTKFDVTRRIPKFGNWLKFKLTDKVQRAKPPPSKNFHIICQRILLIRCPSHLVSFSCRLLILHSAFIACIWLIWWTNTPKSKRVIMFVPEAIVD